MIINHNMASLNTYRQMSVNETNTQSSLAKLSSGLRINKAGDDAAGLAISEKMRGQIRGLDQASRNAQDAISMISTAEGSLSETHSILQRMKELTTQAANDTNTADDRNEIQKEVNQLTSEINRIGNTTEFNTKKLLDGTISLSGSARELGSIVSYSAGTLSDLSVDPNASAATGDYKIEVENLGGVTTQVVSDSQTNTTGKAMTIDEAGTATDVALAEGNYKVHIESASAKSTNTIVGTDVLNTTGGNSPITVDANSTLADADATYSVEVTKTTAYNATAVNGGGISAVDADSDPANIATEGTYNITTKAAVQTNNAAAIETGGAMSNVTIAANSTYANATGYKIVVTQTDTDETDGGIGFTFELQDSTNAVLESASTTVTNAAGSTEIKLGDISFDLDNAKMWASDATGDATAGSFDANTVALTIGNTVEVTQAATSNTETSGFIADGADVASQVFAFDDGGKLALTVTDSGNQFVRGNSFSTTVSYDDTWSIQMKDGAAVHGDAVTLTEADLVSGNVTNIQIGEAGDGVQIDLDATALNAMASGAGGTKTSTFNVDTSTELTATIQNADGSAYAGAGSYAMTGTTAADVVDLGFNVELNYKGTDMAAGDIYFSIKDATTADDFRMSLVSDVDGNGTYETTDVNQQAFNRGDSVTLGSTGITIDTDAAVTAGTTSTFSIENGAVDKSLSMQIGANQGQSFSVDISDMRATALKISGDTAGAAGATSTGVIGAAFTATKSATNGTNNTAEEYALDVSTSEKASAAIKVIENSINQVSAERSKLGAFTNRLEHTITNIGTSSENLTAAESRIRDVDMAKEMMNFQKNNILQQAAQAMLAQANQQPQGVLQLLR